MRGEALRSAKDAPAPLTRRSLRSRHPLPQGERAVTHHLHISRLTLTEFRNHAALDLALDSRPVCLFGANGAGKTNILEALTMLAPGRGLRSASPLELARDGGEGRAQLWAVSARVAQDSKETVIGVGAERTPEGGVKRSTRRDGAPATASDL